MKKPPGLFLLHRGASSRKESEGQEGGMEPTSVGIGAGLRRSYAAAVLPSRTKDEYTRIPGFGKF